MKKQSPEETERQCLVDRQTYAKEALLRFVIAPDGRVTPDLACKLPGRGMWVKAEQESVEEAATKNLFFRAAKKQVVVDKDLAQRCAHLLKIRSLEALSMARKAGQAVNGFDKVLKAIQTGDAVMLLHAEDASEDGIRKLKPIDDIPVAACYSRDELSERLGAEHAVHVALLEGTASLNFIREWQRFTGFIKKTPL